ncbi:DUF2628 domain-containing protein [Stenotrophomonas sp. TWI143]|jgi:hypothetical protein|uniref:DUF2628 domain-containing protein n=1 Tax=Stenotrophomonas TaxID=40323 RepID=UPI0021D9489B|nr:DUF2628 domain-containing protein [Stenotrophomonas maltophilia]UXY47950.1 DUF2628 domain-containing protein [Stenotrophomonas maltophilia]HDS1219196.1 DUF2628 domain-containing protein [Stenotrophomonas maltophilia]HDS1232252.1 DUF2628 domain-containing protein [Stenotrophomonas maltophilia]HDS1556758.1 DUF2628 domain-containing protein [Stenotrophomonas maltophilia]
MNTVDLTHFSPKWQFRFNFYRQHGAPKEPGFKQAWRALSFGDRLKINLNIFALFFGPIYLLILGMWRKALVVIGIAIGLAAITMFLPDIVGRAVFIAFNVLVASSTNYSYYLEKVEGRTGWNPFEGMF